MTENEDFDDKIIAEKLDELTKNIQEVIQHGLENNSFIPNQKQYLKWKTKGFEYSDKGVTTKQSTGSYILKDDWSHVASSISILLEKN